MIKKITPLILLLFMSCDSPTIPSDLNKTIQNYFEGRATANITQLKEAFTSDALLFTVKNNKPIQISLKDYFKKVTSDGKKEVKTSILSFDVTNNIALVKTEFKYVDKTYQDYLILLRINEKWKIINKTFTKIK